MKLSLALWALAILPCAVRAKDVPTRQAPSYAASSIANLVTGLPGPFAPNTLVAVYGRNLSTSTTARVSGPTASQRLPLLLGAPPVRVSINGFLAPLEYVSPELVVFLIPANQFPGPANIRLVHNNINGPLVKVTVSEFAPALFETEFRQAFARHAASLEAVNTGNPAVPGETIVLYAGGLGEAVRPPAPDDVPSEFVPILNADQLRVLINGEAVEPGYIVEAGLAAGRPGCYEIVLKLPHDTPEDPELSIAMGDTVSQAGLRLRVRWPDTRTEPQPASAETRSSN